MYNLPHSQQGAQLGDKLGNTQEGGSFKQLEGGIFRQIGLHHCVRNVEKPPATLSVGTNLTLTQGIRAQFSLPKLTLALGFSCSSYTANPDFF